MMLYHGTKIDSLEMKCIVCDFPIASKSVNGFGFYLTNNKAIAECYGNVIEYEVEVDWTCKLMRPIEVNGNKGLEYVLTQHEANDLVLTHAISTTIN